MLNVFIPRSIPFYLLSLFSALYRFFEAEPRAVEVFTFGKGTELNDEFFKSQRLMHPQVTSSKWSIEQ
jgi:hypothetical protein